MAIISDAFHISLTPQILLPQQFSIRLYLAFQVLLANRILAGISIRHACKRVSLFLSVSSGIDDE
jgi:hypothetical protein